MAKPRKKKIGRPSEGLEVVLYVRITKEMHQRLIKLRKQMSEGGAPVAEAQVVRTLLRVALAEAEAEAS